MKTTLSVGLLVLSAGTSLAAYVFEVDGGARIAVESYWEDEDQIHLNRGGVDLSIPKGSVRRMEKLPDSASLPALPASAVEAEISQPEPASTASPEELEQQESVVVRHLLRVQREKFEAEARGDPPRRLLRLAKELKRTQQRRFEILRDLDRLAPAE